MSDPRQAEQMRNGQGFIAALDQSGGSTPKALKLYGIAADGWADDAGMFDLIHQMRSRIIRSPAFTGRKVVGAILFEMTMEREIEGTPTARYLWENRQVVPFLKVDNGLQAAADGVQLMKPIPELADRCRRALAHGVFGTKMRSVIGAADAAGIAANVAQQFRFGAEIAAHGLVPILEPEISIAIADKDEAEAILLDALMAGLDDWPDDRDVMFKLTLPETANHYAPVIAHPKVMRVVALSGGYSRAEANERLAANKGMIASFSRALTEGLNAGQSDAEFDAMLADTIDAIYRASIT